MAAYKGTANRKPDRCLATLEGDRCNLAAGHDSVDAQGSLHAATVRHPQRFGADGCTIVRWR